MPTLLRKYGYRFHFFSAEPDEPPHVHVDGKGASAKVWLRDVEVQWHAGFNQRELAKVTETVRQERKFFLEKWDEFKG